MQKENYKVIRIFITFCFYLYTLLFLVAIGQSKSIKLSLIVATVLSILGLCGSIFGFLFFNKTTKKNPIISYGTGTN
jgi:hypothetical protein